MFKTKRLNDPPPIPYCVKYGPRSGLRTSKKETSVVDFSFLRPREQTPINHFWETSYDILNEVIHFTDT